MLVTAGILSRHIRNKAMDKIHRRISDIRTALDRWSYRDMELRQQVEDLCTVLLDLIDLLSEDEDNG